MKEKEVRILTPTVTLNAQLLELLAITYVEKLEFFKGKSLYVEYELNKENNWTGSIIVSCLHVPEERE